MSYDIFRHSEFDRSIKRLAKRHRSIADDYSDFLDSLQKNPYQGVELCPGIRKIRMAITSKAVARRVVPVSSPPWPSWMSKMVA